jgi:hypothetical protein
VALLQRFIPFRCARGPLPVPLTSSCDRSKLSSVLSSVLSSKIHILKEYFLSFTTCTLFYSTLFLNSLCFSYSKSIIYINYYPYLIIFHTNNFFSLIPISTTFHSFNFNVYLELYLHLINIICELQFIKINNSFTFFYLFLFSFPFFLPFFISSSFHLWSVLNRSFDHYTLCLYIDLLDAAVATVVAEPVVVVFADKRFKLREADKAGQPVGEGARLRVRGGFDEVR